MNEKHIHILLSIILQNGDIHALLRQGLSYHQIAELTNLAAKEGYVLYKDNMLSLSAEGEIKLEELRKRLKKVDKENWIEKETVSMTKKLEKDFIYLPNQNELFF